MSQSRRRFLQIAASAGAVSGSTLLSRGSLCFAAADGAPATMADSPAIAGDSHTKAAAALGDSRLILEFDSNLRMRVQYSHGAPGNPKNPLTHWAPADSLALGSGSRLDHFALREQSKQPVDGALGRGTRLRIVGADAQIEKTVEVELFERHPGFALLRVSYRNVSPGAIAIRSWTNAAVHLPHGATLAEGRDSSKPDFWSFCGSTHEDRRDWVQPVRAGFSQENFMGMSASDYGGGTPIVDVWRRDAGIAIGHLELVPQLVSLPVTCSRTGVDLAMTAPVGRALQPGETLRTPEAFVAAHEGDYFTVLDSYRRVMSDRGIASPAPPPSAYEPIWCAWGYERSCTPELIEATLPKVRELGLRWAVIDDGWQSNVGDWNLSRDRYPGGEADMKRLVQHIRSQDLKPRLWWAPLAASPGSDLLHDHTDLLLLDKDGAVQNVSWWNSFYLCPAYQGTLAYTLDLVRRFIGDWGFAGLKIDGQHLNAVAPCYNPAHHHARPEESVEKLQDFFQAIYQAAISINPGAVIELCPCGTSYSFFNFRSFNQAPASDPESSWQVRHKGKTLKALMGPSAAFAGDHVELSAGGRDFASTVGVGGIISTKFTWPRDPKPKDSFLLTPEREALWARWIALYNERQLPLGTYRGELYDIGFDKPEAHVVEKSGRLYYAFYAPEFNGRVPLRGLTGGRYRVRDYFNGQELGEVPAANGSVRIAFKDFMVLEAIPV